MQKEPATVSQARRPPSGGGESTELEGSLSSSLSRRLRGREVTVPVSFSVLVKAPCGVCGVESAKSRVEEEVHGVDVI